MPEYPIELGRSHPSYPSAALVEKPEEPEKYYPETHVEGVELPDAGEITFRFRTCRTVNEIKADKVCSDIELLSIVGVKESKASSEEEYSGDVLDKLRDEAE